VLEYRFEQDYKTKAAQLERNFRVALASLSKQYKSAGNLDGLLAIKEETTKLDTAAADAAAEPDKGLFFSATSASPSAPVRLASQHRLLVSWKAGGQTRWNLAGVPPGSYRVFLHAYVGPFAGGTLRLSASTSSEVEIEAGESWTQIKVIAAGELAVTPSSKTLQLSVTSARALGLFDLHAVELRPIP
jgi:hypothetical protein